MRGFIIAGSEEKEKNKPAGNNIKGKTSKGVPKGIGEYVDYEEIDKPGKSTLKT